MAMKLHELHPSMIHAPLVLLPAAAAVDLVAAQTFRPRTARLGARLWWLGTGAGLLAGLAGMAASQEVKGGDAEVDDAMYLHGIGNLGLVIAAAGMAVFRSFRRPSVASATVGLAACGAAIYTAYLGGELVYGSGVGVKAMSDKAKAGVQPGVPDLFSAEAPLRLLRDAVKGLAWLLGRTVELVRGEKPLEKAALTGGQQVVPGPMTAMSPSKGQGDLLSPLIPR
ncbi:MAG TPA: DUF2231 domain-containing protein [Myxococcaceae bacterium]|nr:DUF2231 domain-containing protein [Myxococcaceae bacterium]